MEHRIPKRLLESKGNSQLSSLTTVAGTRMPARGHLQCCFKATVLPPDGPQVAVTKDFAVGPDQACGPEPRSPLQFLTSLCSLASSPYSSQSNAHLGVHTTK